MFVARVCMHKESARNSESSNLIWFMYFTTPLFCETHKSYKLAIVNLLWNQKEMSLCQLSRRAPRDKNCPKILCSWEYHKVFFSAGTGVEVLETYISPYLLFFFSTMRSQMSSTCSVFKSCTSWPRILLSSTLGNKRQPLSSELLMHTTRLWALRASLAPHKGNSTVLRTLTTWSLSCLAQFSYFTATKVYYTTASYTYIYTGK